MNTALIPPDQPLRVVVDATTTVSALLRLPSAPLACYVLAHGAGAGMTHRFLQAVADGLAERRIATLRYQFPYLDRGSRRPDDPAVAHAAVRAACRAAHDATGLALVAGGKSFGGRMTSQAEALAHLPNVAGLAFLGFPLTRRTSLRASGPSSCRPSSCRCSSCRGRGTSWRRLPG